MRKYLESLFPSKEPFPVRFAKTGELPDTRNAIIAIDFKDIPSFTDTSVALTCTVVCASDGKNGTLSHLDPYKENPDESAKLYAKKLLEHWGKPVPIILFGASDDKTGIDESMEFARALQRSLQDFGFTISGSDLGGDALYRHGSLEPKSISYGVYNYKGTIKEERRLEF